jgi:hypothetical protein
MDFTTDHSSELHFLAWKQERTFENLTYIYYKDCSCIYQIIFVLVILAISYIGFHFGACLKNEISKQFILLYEFSIYGNYLYNTDTNVGPFIARILICN